MEEERGLLRIITVALKRKVAVIMKKIKERDNNSILSMNDTGLEFDFVLCKDKANKKHKLIKGKIS